VKTEGQGVSQWDRVKTKVDGISQWNPVKTEGEGISKRAAGNKSTTVANLKFPWEFPYSLGRPPKA
jgi:hypothetical protein